MIGMSELVAKVDGALLKNVFFTVAIIEITNCTSHPCLLMTYKFVISIVVRMRNIGFNNQKINFASHSLRDSFKFHSFSIFLTSLHK
jgi:hypothetical protein